MGSWSYQIIKILKNTIGFVQDTNGRSWNKTKMVNYGWKGKLVKMTKLVE